MNLCSDGHDEICYTGRKCPACELIKELADAMTTADKYRKELENMNVL